jgi:hypothetical protein
MRKRRHAGSVTNAAGRHQVSESETGRNRTDVRCTYHPSRSDAAPDMEWMVREEKKKRRRLGAAVT